MVKKWWKELSGTFHAMTFPTVSDTAKMTGISIVVATITACCLALIDAGAEEVISLIF